MRWIVAALVCVATLAAVDRFAFRGTYVATLKSSAAESASHFR